MQLAHGEHGWRNRLYLTADDGLQLCEEVSGGRKRVDAHVRMRAVALAAFQRDVEGIC